MKYIPSIQRHVKENVVSMHIAVILKKTVTVMMGILEGQQNSVSVSD